MSKDPYGITSSVYDLMIEPFLAPIRRRTLDLLRERFGPGGGALILEVACGTGTQSRILAASGFHVLALDRSRGMIRMARKKRCIAGDGWLAPIRSDASRLPFGEKVFDAVVFQMALHEMKDSIRNLSAREAIRVAKRDALLVFADFVPMPSAGGSGVLLAFVERLAGAEHFRNGQRFIKEGGLLHFLECSGIEANPVRRFFHGHVCLAVARPAPSD